MARHDETSSKNSNDREEASGTIEGDLHNPVFRSAVNREAKRLGIKDPIFRERKPRPKA